jgi:hypothetical protein
VSELQDLQPPTGVSLDLHIENGAYILGDSPGLGLRVDEEAIAAARHLVPDPLSGGSHIRPERAGHRLHAAKLDGQVDNVVLKA